MCQIIKTFCCLCGAVEEFTIPCKNNRTCPLHVRFIYMGCLNCLRSRFKKEDVVKDAKLVFD
ncbi:MAG: hypothetical protein BYD32DRAFT_405292 [Podila humilis]|nr:MAG: hypothetical protein BYD32DRAFT_405292 [Podila humilis]